MPLARPIVLLSLVFPMAFAAQEEGGDPAPKGPSYPIGETLIYEAKLLQAGDLLSKQAGRAELSCTRTTHDSKDAIRYRAVAKINALGFEVSQEDVSLLDPKSGTPILYTSSGTATVDKRTEFKGNQAKFWKKKHCKNEDGKCQEDHWVDGEPCKGHCRNRHCGIAGHRAWSLRDTLDIPNPTFDPISGILAGRRIRPAPDKTAEKIQVLVDDRLWEIDIKVEDGKEIETPAGTFQTHRLTLIPKHLNPKPWHEGDEPFQGPFRLQGDVEIWIDRENGVPIRLRGKLNLGIPMDAEINLIEVRNEGDRDPEEGDRDREDLDPDVKDEG